VTMNIYPWLQNVGSFLLLLGAFGVVGWFCHWIGVQNGYDDCLDDLNAEVARRDGMIK
jgi:hypothetical protein